MNLLFVLSSLLTAFVVGAAGVTECAAGVDDVTMLYDVMITSCTTLGHFRLLIQLLYVFSIKNMLYKYGAR